MNNSSPNNIPAHIMEILQGLDARVADLEMKAAYSDDLLEQLNWTIYQQQNLIDRLTGQIKDLRQENAERENKLNSDFTQTVLNERPPHY